MTSAAIQSGNGRPQPLGTSVQDDSVNFALFSKKSTAVTLCLFEVNTTRPFLEIRLNPEENKTGDIWHISLSNLPANLTYLYRTEGPNDAFNHFDPKKCLLDPFAKQVISSNLWGGSHPNKTNTHPKNTYFPLGAIDPPAQFDWENDKFPLLPQKDLIIYEMHVRGFTRHSSSKTAHPGTFLGVIEKIPHLLDLGVNAVELMPIHEFNEQEFQKINPKTKEHLYNYWGYSTVNFFAPMQRYATNGTIGTAITEFKMMVKELHKNGIEVILDVVYNHTAEGGQTGPTISFKGLANPIYYILNDQGQYQNYSGCGNTVNSNHPVVRELIRKSLRYWVTEMHVDGFRFDLASILTRGTQGQPLPSAPVIEMISEDPILAQTKLIAEPWDAAGLYHVGGFYPQEPRWGEWNGKYRDCIRKFIKGTSGIKAEFSTRICGSQDLYGQRTPASSINFIVSHDGFTLADLVSYDQKHNLANLENNADGLNENESWNCGAEGNTANPEILALRKRQMRNMHLALMVSQGVPMILMGDEYAHTKHGNNNTWCHDNELNWFLWDQLPKHADFYRFYKMLIHFRRQHPILRHEQFDEKEILWHSQKLMFMDWHNEDRLLAFTLKDNEKGSDLYVAFNANHDTVTVQFPENTDKITWHWIVNTANDSPNDFYEEIKPETTAPPEFQMIGYSAVMLKAIPKS